MAVAEAAGPWLARRTAGKGAMEQTVSESLAGVRFLASRLASRLPAHVDIDDLVQVGLMGLIQSAHRYDSERGVKFQTYATRRIQGAMLDYLRSLDWRPRSVRKRNRKIARAFAVVEQRNGTSASEEEVAAEIGLSSPEFHQWMKDYSNRGNGIAHPFPDWLTEEKSGDPLDSIADSADSPEKVVEKEQLRGHLAQAVDRLPEKERDVLTMYYFEQRTMKEIGRLLGVKQARVSQIHSQAVQRLRRRMRAESGSSPLQPGSVPSSENARLP